MELIIYPHIVSSMIRSREDKNLLASTINDEGVYTVKTFSNISELILNTTSYAWNPSVYHGRRLKSNFQYSDLIALDVDSGQTIEEARKVAEKLNIMCLCTPSMSHTEDAHKFRLIFPLARRISNRYEYEYNWKLLAKEFTVDEQTKDCLRFYYPGKHEGGFLYEAGELYEPKPVPVSKSAQKVTKLAPVGSQRLEEIYADILNKNNLEALPKSVRYFTENAHTGIPKGWHNSCNNFCFMLSSMGMPYERVRHLVEQLAPLALDDEDERRIYIACKDGEQNT